MHLGAYLVLAKRTTIKTLARNNLYILSVWLGLVIISLISRFYLPIDETRYVTVAWNMWLDHDYLVPHLNGLAYSHKPPLLFWLINLGWQVFGVNEWWPRLVPSFFTLASVFLTQRLSLRLWPTRPNVAMLSSLLLTGSMLWMVFSTATMFDMLVTFFTVLGALGIVTAWQDGGKRGWLLVALALGGGLLSKGPAIFVQLLPLALLGPWWMQGDWNQGERNQHKRNQPDAPRTNYLRWYASLGIAVLLGSTICLAWAIPAGMAGGLQYQREIFMGQTVQRMAESAPHVRPLWWYLQMLPLFLLPWTFVLPVWRGLRMLPAAFAEAGLRLCIAWILPALAIFSLIAGKQLHYLLPLYPAIAMLMARGLDNLGGVPRRDQLVLAGLGLLLGALVLAYPYYEGMPSIFRDTHHLSLISGLLIIGLSVAMAVVRTGTVVRYTWLVSIFSCSLVAILYTTFISVAGNAYDLKHLSRKIKTLEAQHVPLAYVGKYHGQFNFVGRLRQSPESVHQPALTAWFDAHPGGRAIVFFGEGKRHRERQLGDIQPEVVQSYRGGKLAILDQQSWSAWEHARTQRANESVSFFATGDQGSGLPAQYDVARGMESLAELNERLDFVVLMGDNFYNHSVTSLHSDAWASRFEQVYLGDYLQRVPFYGVLGNHDQNPADNGETSASLQIEYSQQKLGSQRWHMPDHFYSQDYGLVDGKPLLRIVYIDSNLNASQLQAQAAWLQQQFLKAPLPVWRIAIGHHPVRNYGKHRAETPRMVTNILPALKLAKVDLYLCGHDHNQQVISRQNEPAYFISGAGGAELYPIDLNPPDLLFARKAHGFVSVQLNKDRLKIGHYDVDGKPEVTYKMDRSCDSALRPCLRPD